MIRDGVNESQFNQVLNIELEHIMSACNDSWEPKFMVIVAQKTHHTKFFQTNSDYNVPPGTIVDNKVCHPKYHDFYLCAQNGPIIGFSADQLQELVHSLSCVLRKRDKSIYSQSKYESEDVRSGADIDGIREEGSSCVANFIFR
ncbi:hypothetical protein QVD17_14730 [Tagetes erecta]|uniref:Piwi domain-containing protein n=1 Tax=Tagetes erecta TaxID=13708 RepID=A0AAD8NYX0_TARER|nr:hypothetical protein QVD17_14730 [Tagetes erecta]